MDLQPPTGRRQWHCYIVPFISFADPLPQTAFYFF
jgi:hypothetical protein